MKQISGLAAATGLAAGMVVTAEVKEQSEKKQSLEEIKKECVFQTEQLYKKTCQELGEESGKIFKAYLALLADPCLYENVEDYLKRGKELEEALECGFEETAAIFDSMKNEYMQQRAEDIRALKKMHMEYLNGCERTFHLPDGDTPYIVVAEELTPVDTMKLDHNRLAGIITKHGGATSHVVILAKTLGIPAIIGVKELEEIYGAETILMDGENGVITIEPEKQVLNDWNKKYQEWQKLKEIMKNLPSGPVYTKDGTEVHVSINIGGSKDMENVDFASLYGVGLYRTEFLFTDLEKRPDVETQRKEYRKVFEQLGNKDLIVRTLDIGGDKQIDYLDLPKEDNPFLGCRGLRLCLQEKTLLEEQLEALIRASEGKSFSIMFPMIDLPEEYMEAKQILRTVCNRLQKEGCAINTDIKTGIMVETPAAAICIDQFMEEVDFVSIGTNDLTQYVMAADRGNASLNNLQTVYQPAVVRMISHIIQTCRSHNVKVSVCGEAGSDPKYLQLMIGMGLRYVSVSKSLVNQVRYSIMHTSAAEMDRKAEMAVKALTAEEVRLII